MTTRFKTAYDALYKAFMNGTLAKGNLKKHFAIKN